MPCWRQYYVKANSTAVLAVHMGSAYGQCIIANASSGAVCTVGNRVFCDSGARGALVLHIKYLKNRSGDPITLLSIPRAFARGSTVVRANSRARSCACGHPNLIFSSASAVTCDPTHPRLTQEVPGAGPIPHMNILHTARRGRGWIRGCNSGSAAQMQRAADPARGWNPRAADATPQILA